MIDLECEVLDLTRAKVNIIVGWAVDHEAVLIFCMFVFYYSLFDKGLTPK